MSIRGPLGADFPLNQKAPSRGKSGHEKGYQTGGIRGGRGRGDLAGRRPLSLAFLGMDQFYGAGHKMENSISGWTHRTGHIKTNKIPSLALCSKRVTPLAAENKIVTLFVVPEAFHGLHR